MNILEEILEEIESLHNKILHNKFAEKVTEKEIVALVKAKEIIRSHMDDVPKCGDCSRRKWYQEGYKDGKDTNAPGNDGWIPVGERLPEERDSIFAKLKNADKLSNIMFAKESDKVNITYEFEDGTRKTGTSYTVDGVWEIEQKYRAKKRKVIAWKPLPEPYKGE